MKIHRSLGNLPNFRNSVITFGTFDGVHLGHQKIIRQIISVAKETKGESIVVTFDPHPRSIVYPKDKSLKLLTTLNEKINLFKKTGLDHLVILPFTVEFSQIPAREYVDRFIIKNFNPKCVVVGYDHKFGLNRQGDFNLLKEYSAQGKFKLIKIEKQVIEENTISSTKIRHAISSGDVSQGNLLLGFNYMITGEVVHGDKIGSKIGFPTANLVPDDKNKIIPKVGVYAARVHAGGVKANGMVYIGNRPTIGSDLSQNIEVNIFDFKDNIYNTPVTLELVQFIREDEKFENLELLTNQLKLDRLSSIEVLSKIKENKISSSCGICILAYNNSEMLQSYLPIATECKDDSTQIHVIDNASEDDTVEMLAEWFPEINVVELTENYGFAEGYNRGIRIIENKYIVLLNSDVMVTPNWLDPLIEKLESDPSIGAVMPKVLSLEQQDHFEYAGAAGGFIDSLGYPFCRGRIFNHCEIDEGQYDDEQEVFWTSGAAMVLRRSTFIGLGGFDNSFFAHQEEIDLCWRMRRAGLKCLVLPKSVVYHLGGGSLDYESPRKTYLNFRNNLTTIIKNENNLKLLWLLPIRFMLDGLAGIQFLLKGKPKHTWSIVRAHFSLYKRVFRIYRRKRKERAWVEEMQQGPPRIVGKIPGSIIWSYFIRGKKKFSNLG